MQTEIASGLRVLQTELIESAYEMAKKGRELIGNGASGAASELLTGYMAENARRVVSKVKMLVPANARLISAAR